MTASAEKLRPMQLELEIATLFKRVLQGEQLNQTIEDWGIDSSNGGLSFHNLAGKHEQLDVNFGFQLCVSADGPITLRNNHRFVHPSERRKGLGTRSLRLFERCLSLATDNPLQIDFAVLEEQTDTKAWLLINGYSDEGIPTLEKRRIFSKVIQPTLS